MSRLPIAIALAAALTALAACETADQTAQSGETIQWNAPRPTDVQTPAPAQPAPPAASPAPAVEPAGEPECREFQNTVTIGGKPEKVYGRACRQPDGTWKQVGALSPTPQAAPSQAEQTYPYGWYGYEYPYGPHYGPGYGGAGYSVGVGAGSRGGGGFFGYGVGF